MATSVDSRRRVEQGPISTPAVRPAPSRPATASTGVGKSAFRGPTANAVLSGLVGAAKPAGVSRFASPSDIAINTILNTSRVVQDGDTRGSAVTAIGQALTTLRVTEGANHV